MINSKQQKPLNTKLIKWIVLLCLPLVSFAQNTINGTITDTDNTPLWGVNVIVKEAITNGTDTDENGQYNLILDKEAKTLIFSFVGFKTQEVIINNQNNIDIVLIEESTTLDQVVVTSRKTIENVQKVPIAVSPFSAKMLKDRGISNVGQLADYVPNVEIDVNTAFGGSQSVLSPFIRGIGQNDFAITYEPAVGLYVDGVYYGRGVGSVVDMLDVDRIEVLKGPQGTLFGRNTIAGAINVTTKEPGKKFELQGQLNTGSFNRFDSRITANIPLIEDQLYSSISFSSVNRDGYVKRIPYKGVLSEKDGQNIGSLLGNGQYTNVGNSDNLGNQNNDTWRAKFLWKASDKFKVTLNSDYVRVRENESPGSLVAVEGDTTPGPPDQNSNLVEVYNFLTQIPSTVAGLPENSLTGRTPYDERFLTGDPFTTYGTSEGGSRIDVWGLGLTLDYKLSDHLTLKSISSYRNLESAFAQDGDHSPLSWASYGFKMPQKQFTQEFQLSGKSDKLKWIAGLYHFQEDGSVLDEVYLGLGIVQVYGLNIIKNKTYAAFAQATYNLTDKWSVTGGARFTNEQKFLDGRQRNYNYDPTRPGNENIPVANDPTLLYPPGGHNQEFNVPTFRIGTEYQITDDIFTYGYFAQGFKSGGWTTRVTVATQEAPTFEPERANTYELGVKSEFADNKLRLNLAGFYTDYQDMQITVRVGVSPTVLNAAEATIKGIEGDLQWVATDNLKISANAGLLSTKYKNVTDSRATIDDNDLFLNAPRASGSISVDYVTHQDYDKGRIGLHIDSNTKSNVANDVENTPYLMQEDVTLLNGYLFYEPAQRQWKLTLGATNITDELYIVSGNYNASIGNAFAVYGRPFEFNVGLNFKL